MSSRVILEIWLKIAPFYKRPVPQPECSDSELLTMVLVGECRPGCRNRDAFVLAGTSRSVSQDPDAKLVQPPSTRLAADSHFVRWSGSADVGARARPAMRDRQPAHPSLAVLFSVQFHDGLENVGGHLPFESY